MTTEAQLREDMAPRIAAKLLARHRPTGWTIQEAQELAFEIIAMVQAATMQATIGMGATRGDQ